MLTEIHKATLVKLYFKFVCAGALSSTIPLSSNGGVFMDVNDRV